MHGLQSIKSYRLALQVVPLWLQCVFHYPSWSSTFTTQKNKMNSISMSVDCHSQMTKACLSHSPSQTFKEQVIQTMKAIFNRSKSTLSGRRLCISHSLSSTQYFAASRDFSLGRTQWIKLFSGGFSEPGSPWLISLWLENMYTGTSKTWRQDRQLHETQFTTWSAQRFLRRSR